MRRQIRYGAVVTTQAVRPRPALSDIYADIPLQNAFLVTEHVEYRLTDLAACAATEHYVEILVQHQGETNAERVRATRVAVAALAWLQQPPRILTPADYDAINQTLGELPPSYAVYQSTLNAYQTMVRALRPEIGAPQPVRAAYHRARLHYILPSFVRTRASQDLVRTLCDFRLANDADPGNNFAVVELSEAEWGVAWAGLTLAHKLRWYEFRAVVEASLLQNRLMTYLYTAIASICKGGAATQEWCETRIKQMAQMHGVVIDKALFTPAILAILFQEFVIKA